MSNVRTITVNTTAGAVEVTITEEGEGRPFLLLHGGAGPQSVLRFAGLLAATEPALVVTPSHPGFAGTTRPEGLATMRGLAGVYVALLDALDLHDVTVVGNSIGGWIAAEVALLGSGRVSGLVVVDGGGLRIEEHPAADFFALGMDQIINLSYRDPERFRIDLAAMPPEQRAGMAANRAALQAYGGATMDDATLLERLPAIAIPTLVVWGEADRMIPVEHGHAYAEAIPGAELRLIREAGHLPQLETPELLVRLVWGFATGHSA